MTAINANNRNRSLNFNDRENSTFPENINAQANYSTNSRIGTAPSIATLYSAIIGGNVEDVRALLNEGADIAKKDIQGDIPIHWGAFLGKTQIVSLLIERNASLINVKGQHGYTPLHWAARYGHTETLRVLINKGANVIAKDNAGNIPIHLAALSGKTQVINLLIEHDPSFINVRGWNNYTPLHWAITGGNIETILALLNRGANINAKANYIDDLAGIAPSLTALHLAAINGHIETVQALLNKGADVTAKDKDGNMPIHLAASSGETQVVNALIERAPSLVNVKGWNNYTPLHGAAEGGYTETVQALLNKGAEVTAKDNAGNIPIHLAALSGKTQVINLLIEHDPSFINVRGWNNYTPLHWAAYKGRTETVQALLNKGANISLRNSADQTPLSIAGNAPIASLLRSHGTTLNKRAIEENLSFSLVSTSPKTRKDIYNLNAIDTTQSRSSIETEIAPLSLPQTNHISTVGIAYNQSQELPYNNSSSAVDSSSFLNNQNISLVHCIINTFYNSTMSSRIGSRQALINQGVPLVSTKLAVECALRDFDSFVEKEMKELNSEEQIYARSKLEKAYPRIIARLEKAHQTNGEPGLDKALKLSKERFCNMLLRYAQVSFCLANVNVEALSQAAARN